MSRLEPNEDYESPTLTRTEVATRYGVSVQCIENRVNRGEFPPADLRRGPKLRPRVEWSRAYLEAYDGRIGKGAFLSDPRFAEDWYSQLAPDAREFCDPHGKVRKQIQALLAKVKHRTAKGLPALNRGAHVAPAGGVTEGAAGE